MNGNRILALSTIGFSSAWLFAALTAALLGRLAPESDTFVYGFIFGAACALFCLLWFGAVLGWIGALQPRSTWLGTIDRVTFRTATLSMGLGLAVGGLLIIAVVLLIWWVV